MYNTISPSATSHYFLKLVADDLRQKIGNDLSHTVVVFPNKRASLFFNEHLVPLEARENEAPIWSPRYQTISELFRSLSPLTVADPIETVCYIYQAYKRLTHSQETLDFFYGWGERLLSDFDDVDKNMADATRLFRNLKEIKELENSEFVDEEQEKVLQEFFRDFSLQHNSYIRKNFLELWNQMLPIYQQVNADLAKEGMAYEGALYRNVLENLEAGKIQMPDAVDHYVFVGFNVLDQVEERFFKYLQKGKKAMFYWDYDNSYAGEGTQFEAGIFLRNNLEKFPNELPSEYFNNLEKDKEIEFVSSPTENAQARAVTPWLQQHLTADEKRTAVVLCNEDLLQPVLHALPPEVKEANITKGFPFTQTPAFALMEKAMDEVNDADYPTTQMQALLLKQWQEQIHQTAMELPKEGTALFKKVEHELYSEAYFQSYTILNRFLQLVESDKLKVTLTTLRRLIKQVMKQTSIPFHGEPAVGLQVMGVLETRNLDFENILMLSVNEGALPKKATDNSFIPYHLRQEFGLTTSRHKTAVFAYYFYRLIQRAKKVRMIYNCSSEGLIKGEMSRFMTQLLIETKIPIRHFALTSEQSPVNKMPRPIQKPADLVTRLPRISPSAINTYIRCQLQFYFQYIARLKEPEPAPNVIEANTFGTIFHKAAELMYQKSDPKAEKGRIITLNFLQQFNEAKHGNELLMEYVKQAFEVCKIDYNEIVAAVVRTYLKQLVNRDLKLVPFEVVDTEKDTEVDLSIPYQDGTATVKLKGQIDRLDMVNINGISTLRVVDYKTGGKPEKAKDLEQLFTPAERHPHYILQTFLYALTLGKQPHPVAPALFFVHQAAKDDYDPYLDLGKEKVMDFQEIASEFQEGVVNLIAEILDGEKKFVPTDVDRFCSTCPFQTLCFK